MDLPVNNQYVPLILPLQLLLKTTDFKFEK